MTKSQAALSALSLLLSPAMAILPVSAAYAADPPAAMQPAGFAPAALKGGKDEIALAELAVAKTADTEIKELSQMLIADHTALNKTLARLAGKNAASVPPGPDSLQRLSALSGLAFDRAVIDAIVEGHQKSVKLYTTEAESGTNAGTKKFAADNVAKIKLHLEHALALQKKLASRS